MINERKLTERELESRESVLKGLLSNKRNLVKKYGKDAEKVMYGIATKKAKSKVEGMNKDRIKELIQLQLELAPNNKFDDESPKSTEFDSNSNKSYSGGADYGSEVSANTAEDSMEVGELKEDKFSNASMNDVMQSIRNLAHATGMDELEAAEIAINEIRIEFGVDAFHESTLDRRVAKIDEMIDYDESLNLRAIKAELEGEIQGVRMEMEDEGDESKADYYGDILNRFESRLAKVQRQLDDYDMNEGTDNEREIKEETLGVEIPSVLVNKANAKITNSKTFSQFVLDVWDSITPKENESIDAIQALKIARDKLETAAKIEDASVEEKLTKSSSVEDHVEDFKDSDAPQFKGKSKDKKIQMAVASYLSKQGKSVKENKVADKDIEKEIKLLQDENPKGFEKEIKKLKVRQAALKLSK